jgi:hypothetical protein
MLPDREPATQLAPIRENVHSSTIAHRLKDFMRNIRSGLTLAGIAALLLWGCGGGGGGGSSSGGSQNSRPTATAGAAQNVVSGVTVTLNGSGADSDGTIASYAWTQTAGAAVVLSSASIAAPTFTAPSVATSAVLTFSLVVTDNRGASSPASTVNITVNTASNLPPIANAGIPASVTSGILINLDSTASTDPDGVIASYAWTQTAGPAVTLSNTSGAQPAFTTPMVATTTTLTFSLVVTDNFAAVSAPSTVSITVNPVPAGNVSVAGVVRFAVVPVGSGGLEYAIVTLVPARGVVVRVVNANTQAVLATGTTDGFGVYALSVPENTTVVTRVVAQMLRDGTQSLPRWDVEVQNGVGGAVYTHDSAAFNSGTGTGVTQNVDIPLGINTTGTATGTRASGPFAVLNTIYTAMQAILTVAPTTDFPPLVVSWGPQSQSTFFSGGNPQYIELLADLTADTDEFDRHVVAHEFGHYIEHNFSRSDSIGGPHGVGDRLDIRVAFGEGFGYAFAAIVLDDPNALDSFVDNGVQRAGGFNIEDNPPAPGDNVGCWCSESSVWSVVYDIFDSDQDSGDSVALGFQPIWNVLVSAQADTPAFTSIFSFITALKVQASGSVPAINNLLSAQNMVTNTDAFGSTETTLPSPLPTAAVFPLYTTAVIGGGPVTVRTVNDAGTTNKLGNHRYIRFENNATRNVTITLSSSNPNNSDPDFLVWRAGTFIRAGIKGPPGPEVETINNLPAGSYLIDVYDCANGCNPAEGSAGDYDLTVTIN